MGRGSGDDGRGRLGLRFGIAAVVCGTALVAAAAERGGEDLCRFSRTITGSVAAIVDGDTLRLADGTLVRLAAVEAPGDPAPAVGDRAPAEAAASFLGDAALGRPVVLSPLAKDRYGRLRADVHLADGRWLQAELVAAGLARVRPGFGESGCARLLLAIEAGARRRNRGIWASPAFAVKTADDPSLLARSGLYEVVEGRVVSVARGLRLAFIDFGRDFRRDFTVMVPNAIVADWAAAGMPLEGLRGRRVRVRGLVEESGGPAIRLADSIELELVDESGAGGDGE
jgi:endonuclease YncB( thermonuclease family)